MQQSLKELFKGRTSIYIAHRLSTIADADKIIVLGSQGVIEEGSHNELIQKGGVYNKMWMQQKANPEQATQK
jgi:ABC-type transport system involved in Fe-S cluster assembly fused permease/ATPase subunit